MKSRFVGVLSVLLVACLASPCLATVIQIANPGFDADALGVGGYTLNPTDWLVSAGATGALRSPAGGLTSISPDNFGFLNPTGWLGQLLKVNGSVLHANAGDQVSISLSQGLRNDATASTQDLRIRLWSNQIGTGTLLQETAFSAVPATTWVTRNVTYTASGSGVGNDLYLQLASVTADYAQVNVEDVSGSYNAVPEPGSLALLIAGLISLLAYAWRKSR